MGFREGGGTPDSQEKVHQVEMFGAGASGHLPGDQHGGSLAGEDRRLGSWNWGWEAVREGGA